MLLLINFARHNWDRSPQQQQGAWNDFIKGKRLEEKLKDAIDIAIKSYRNRIGEILEEIGQDIKFSREFRREYSADFSGVDPGFDFRTTLEYCAVLVGGLAMLMSGIPGVVLVVAAVGPTIISFFLPDKKERQQEACRKVLENLEAKIKDDKETSVEKMMRILENLHDQIHDSVNAYFNGIVGEFGTIANDLSGVEEALQTVENRLNKFFALRILDWCNGIQSVSLYKLYERLSREIDQIKRESGNYFETYLDQGYPPPCPNRQRQCSQILGEHVSFRQSNCFSVFPNKFRHECKIQVTSLSLKFTQNYNSMETWLL
ncbi:hypothetical protein [Trichothermofontia sp.]